MTCEVTNKVRTIAGITHQYDLTFKTFKFYFISTISVIKTHVTITSILSEKHLSFYDVFHFPFLQE